MYDLTNTDSADAIAQHARDNGDTVIAELMDQTLAAVEASPHGYTIGVPAASGPVEELWWSAVVFGAALEREYPRDETAATTEVGP